jgi:hypothetical protein
MYTIKYESDAIEYYADKFDKSSVGVSVMQERIRWGCHGTPYKIQFLFLYTSIMTFIAILGIKMLDE